MVSRMICLSLSFHTQACYIDAEISPIPHQSAPNGDVSPRNGNDDERAGDSQSTHGGTESKTSSGKTLQDTPADVELVYYADEDRISVATMLELIGVSSRETEVNEYVDEDWC